LTRLFSSGIISAMAAPRIILCLDLDAFFASVEELLHPEWRGQPILVGGRPEERGVVASCSYAARAFGVHSAMPMGQALQRCPHAIVTPSRHSLYSDYSRRVMAIVGEYGCPMEQVSVDEVFFDATECASAWGGARALAQALKRRIVEEIGLRCTIGIASNKLVAKIACIQGKPDGLIEVPPGDEARFLAPLPISELWGVGPKGAAQLKAMGIHTVGDLQNAPLETLKFKSGSWALELQRKARGVDSSLVETEHETKSISRETTFVKDVGDLAQLKRVLLSLSEGVGHDLRSEGLQAKTIGIKLRWPNFQTITRQTTLKRPTDSTSDIYQAASALLAAAVKRGAKVRLLGVRATHLAGGRQLDLFDAGSEKRARLDKAVDDIRDRYGEKAIRRAALIRKRGASPKE
jgi:DNA polymerase-4